MKNVYYIHNVKYIFSLINFITSLFIKKAFPVLFYFPLHSVPFYFPYETYNTMQKRLEYKN